jgi:asparagine synthase (glutamine-hydrolysing)
MLRGAPVDPERIAAMRDSMRHRGPDDAGLRVDGSVALAHRRLSILDLSPLGHQPMSNEDGTVWIVFNGEIYNYLELAQELKARGHVMHSGSDTEVIVHLWEEMGPRCVERLNGMFAFVIWDANRRELFGARDRMGIKPFFYHHGADRFIAASEIKAILADPAVRRAPDNQGLSDFLLTGFPMGEKTAFAGIRQLQPGYALSLKDGELRTWQYWDLEFRPNHTRSATDTLAELTALLDDAVAIHCRSDAPLGCHLSGGLDSSAVVAFARRHHDPLETFSIRFGGGAFFDESSHARAVARHVGTVHWEAKPAHGDLAALLASLAWHCDVPMPGHTIFAYHAASRLAAERVTVALTGHGGDEVFAGYPAQFQAAFGSTAMFDLSARPQARVGPWTRLRAGLRRHGIAGVARRVLARGAAAQEPQDLESLWLALHCGTPPLRSPLLSAGFRQQLGGYDSVQDYLAPLSAARSDDVLDRCLYHDLRSYLPGLLHQEDRASMAVSIESRVPLLDYRVVEFLATVPTDIKVPDRVPKGLLRRVAAPMLPHDVVYRKDKGAFGVPTGEWFRGPLRGFLHDLVLSDRARARGVLEARELSDPSVSTGTLWAALSLELWFRLYIDEDRDLLGQVGAASAVADVPSGVQVAA